MTEKKLTPRQKLFIEEYLQSWNASDAARKAGYTGAANMTGPRLLANDSIKAAIKARMAEKTIQTDEVLKRLTDMAQINISDFITETTRYFYDKDGNQTGETQIFELNWEMVKQKGHLIKSITNTQWGPKIELYDGQTALIKLGTALGALTERVDMTSQGEQINLVVYMPDNRRDNSDGDKTSDD